MMCRICGTEKKVKFYHPSARHFARIALKTPLNKGWT